MATKKIADKQRKTVKKRGPGRPWPKGQSGNPKGRPPSKKYLSEALREWLGHPSDRDPERTNADELAAALGKAALKGSVTAIALIADRVEGKPRQTIELSLEQQKRELAEKAIEALMLDAGVDRETAIAELARLTPEVTQWIN
jgi:hypothetical protein